MSSHGRLTVSYFEIFTSCCKMTNTLLHSKCRGKYAGGVKRFPVPDDKVSWSVDWPEYKPVDYTAPVVERMPIWADIDYRYVVYM